MTLKLAVALSTSVVLVSACGGSVAPGVDPEPIAVADAAADGGADTSSAPDTRADVTPADTRPEVDTAEAAPVDTGPVVDHGAPSTKYPAFAPVMPQLVNHGGAVLLKPVLVTVTFPSEKNVDAYEAFDDNLGPTSYWKEVASEYGVGPTVSDAIDHVRMTTTLPDAMDDGELDTYVGEHALNYAKYGWPAPTDQTIYVLVIPPTTAVSLSGRDTCSTGIGGFHTSTTVGAIEVAYAIVLQCTDPGVTPRLQSVTASHEIGEAATDPHPQLGFQGFEGVDDDDIAWRIMQNGAVENGDLCENDPDARYRDTVDPGFAYRVQRQWSNASSKLGHNPCVPVPPDPYFNVVGLELEKVTFNASDFGLSSRLATRGYHVAVGETKTFPIGFWSDGPTAAWTLAVQEGTPFAAPPKVSRLDVSLDKYTGSNGEKAYVTVTVKSATGRKASILTIQSSDGGTEHYMPILISSQ